MTAEACENDTCTQSSGAQGQSENSEKSRVRATNCQKLKILHLLRMLLEKSDEKQGLTMAQLIDGLAQEGIASERKSVYRDLQALRDFGVSVKTLRRSPVEYAIAKERLPFSTIMLLIDTAQSSKFLTEAKSRQLVSSLKSFASEREQKLLEKRVHVAGRVKSQSESVFHNVDLIHEAIQQKCKISFQYCKYGTDKQQHPRYNGKIYVETPVKIVFNDGFYYLAAYNDSHQHMVTYRIDRMKLLQITDEPATRNQTTSTYAFEDFEYQSFGMFDGDIVNVTLHVAAEGMDVIIDRFGTDVVVTNATPEACDVHATVRVSDQFYSWVAGLRNIVELTAPSSLVEKYRDWVRSLL